MVSARVIDIFVAAMLRDMRTRFGRSYISFIISIGWPLSHMGIITGVYYFTHKFAPIGDDPGIFATTGIAPYIFCLYPARFMAMAILQNKPLLQFSVVMPIYLLAARAALEFLSAVVGFLIFVCALWVADIAIAPFDPYLAALALLATIYFGLCIGVFGVLIVAFQPLVGILVIVFSVLGMYLSSGALVPPTGFSDQMKDILWYNPLYQCVGLLRSAYYVGYDAHEYSLFYVILVASTFLALGLAGERMLRGKLIMP